MKPASSRPVPSTNAPRVLLVEDNPADARLTQKALEHHELPVNLSIVGDGIEALSHLRERNEGLPELVLLDLNLPRMNGREVLAEIKNDPKLKHIPVVVWSTSDSPEEIRGMYGLYANSYVVKPVDLKDYRTAVATIRDFWIGRARRPSSPDDEPPSPSPS